MRIPLNDKISASTSIIVAIFVLVSIRLSSYILPEKYYFSVSSVFKSDDSLMLVDHPGVSGQRFCEIIRKYKLTANDLRMDRLDCTKERAQENQNLEDQTLSAKHRSEIYDRWIDSKDQIGKALNDSLDRRTLAIAIFKGLQSIEVYERQGVVFAGRFAQQIENSLDAAVSASISNFIRPHFSSLTAKFREELQPSLEHKNPYGEDIAVDDEQFERIRQAIAVQVTMRVAKQLGKKELVEIGFEDMKTAVESAEYYWEIEPQIESAYAEMVTGPYIDIVNSILSDENLRAPDVKVAVKSVHQEFILENLPYYLASATIRFTIVFTAVLLIATASIKNFSIQNYSFGAALAAIMLTWPVISLWSWVVREEWQALKFMFLGIYALYIVAFFFTGKSAAHSAAYIRQYLSRKGYGTEIKSTSENSIYVFQTSIKEIAKNILIATSTSAIVYALNIVVPMNA